MGGIDWLLLLDQALLFAVATLKLLLWLVLRRRTVVGRAIAGAMLAMAIAYYGALLAWHHWAFRSPAWRLSVRVLVGLATLYALWAIAAHLGGWRGTLRAAARGAADVRRGYGDAGRLLAWRVTRAARRARRGWTTLWRPK